MAQTRFSTATRPHRLNSTCRRRRSARWPQLWPSRCFLFFLAQVIKDPIDGLPCFIGYDVLVLDTRVDPGRSATKTADLDVDTEYTLEPLGPGHGGMALGGCHQVAHVLRCDSNTSKMAIHGDVRKLREGKQVRAVWLLLVALAEVLGHNS